MIEGWHGDDYLMLFDEAESATWSQRYEIGKYLTGFTIVGLRSWDDFLVIGTDGGPAIVPTVPLDASYVTPLEIVIDPHRLQPDERFRGMVKWYKSPIVFGGNPTDQDNVAWIPLDAHVDLVKYWNGMYKSVQSRTT